MSTTRDYRLPADEKTVETVRDRYGRIASGQTETCCGGDIVTTVDAEMLGYDESELAVLPDGANLGLGCGAPVSALELQPGETLLDLGSGAGIDAFLAAGQVGPEGRVIGVDLNPTMCLKAQANAAATGTTMECHEGRMEDIPLPSDSVDVVISNGVINLSFRKRKVVEEMFRVLKPGGRISITDIVSGKQLTQSIVNDPKLWAS